VFWLTAWGTAPPFLSSPIFFLRVIRIALRISRFFDPRRQKLQIKKIHSLDSGRAHQFHLLEGDRKATSRCSGGARSHVGASDYTILACRAQSRHLKSAFHGRDQTKIERFDSLNPPARSPFGLSVHVAASRAAPFSASLGMTRITLVHARQAPEND